MNNVFFGSMYIFHNSVEGGVKYLYSPTYKGLLSAMIKYLVDEKLIDAEKYDISFSKSIDFLSDGEGASVSIDGDSSESLLENCLSDLSSDNLNDDCWFSYKAFQGGVIDDKSLIMTISYNENCDDVGYQLSYHTLVGKNLEELRSKFVLWSHTNFGVAFKGFPHYSVEKAMKFLNKRYSDKDIDDVCGLDMTYRIEDVSGKKISGESII